MALSQSGFRRWYLVHKWTSLVSTLFLLMFCITGLPLIFSHEIDGLTRAPVLAQSVASRSADLDRIVARSVAGEPGWKTLYLSWDDERPLIYATIAPTYDAPDKAMKFLQFDARTGEKVQALPLDEGVMHFLLELHSELLMGLKGELFLGLVGVVFLVALVSGVVIYAPFMRKLAFGTVRKNRSSRIKWLDTHNMIGIVTLGWISVVALTGVIITMNTPITMLWQRGQLAELSAPNTGTTLPEKLASVDRVVAAVRAAVPDAHLSFIAWPGTAYSTQHHYMVALAGDTPLTERLIRPALVDAATGKLVTVEDMPWYVKMLFLSSPLHFGDYGGLPLKIIWALLDLATIVVLGTGLYLWLGKRNVPVERRIEALRSGRVLEPAE